MAGRKILNEQEARRGLAAAKSSRGGLAAWAQAHGVDGRSLHCWRLNLGSRSVPRGRTLTPRLVEFVPAAMTTVARAPYVLHISGVEFEVGDGFDRVAQAPAAQAAQPVGVLPVARARVKNG